MVAAQVGLKGVCSEAAALSCGMMTHWCATTKGEAGHRQLVLASNKEPNFAKDSLVSYTTADYTSCLLTF